MLLFTRFEKLQWAASGSVLFLTLTLKDDLFLVILNSASLNTKGINHAHYQSVKVETICDAAFLSTHCFQLVWMRNWRLYSVIRSLFSRDSKHIEIHCTALRCRLHLFIKCTIKLCLYCHWNSSLQLFSIFNKLIMTPTDTDQFRVWLLVKIMHMLLAHWWNVFAVLLWIVGSIKWSDLLLYWAAYCEFFII